MAEILPNFSLTPAASCVSAEKIARLLSLQEVARMDFAAGVAQTGNPVERPVPNGGTWQMAIIGFRPRTRARRRSSSSSVYRRGCRTECFGAAEPHDVKSGGFENVRRENRPGRIFRRTQ